MLSLDGLLPVGCMAGARRRPRDRSIHRRGRQGQGILKAPFMLNFAVFSNGRPARRLNLTGAYLIGNDDVPQRADISFAKGVIRCDKRVPGPAGLVLPWHVDGFGWLLLETSRVLDRDKPFLLSVELARGRLTRINLKIEDWGMLDHDDTRQAEEQLVKARKLLIQALQTDDPAEASAFADQSLAVALRVSEELTRIHADRFLARRKSTGGFGRRVFGCAISLEETSEEYRKRLVGAFDYVSLPMRWRDIEPQEQNFEWKWLDAWVEWLAKKRMPIKGGPLLSFSEGDVPDWLHIWEHDFETLRDLAFEHIRRVITRYNQYVQAWDVVSGIHAQSTFSFNFEPLMELTRMATAAAKQSAPRGLSVVNLVMPWGEYYAKNQRTIPPLLYAEMAVQSGLNFDAFGLEFSFCATAEAPPARDLFQISSLIDQFGKMGKSIHLTAVQVPSRDFASGTGGAMPSKAAGDGWTEQTQSKWLRRFIEIALSKPFVERISWRALSDRSGPDGHFGGLLREDFAPKPAYEELLKVRSELMGAGNK
jgi:hypothetical protein